LRNYLIPVGARQGQTAKHQIDALGLLARALSDALGQPVDALWSVRNGCTLCTIEGLKAVAQLLQACDAAQRDKLRGRVCVGWHRGVDVTDMAVPERNRVDQVYCAALPVPYSCPPAGLWGPLGRLVLEAAYEATLRAACLNAAAGDYPRVLLTELGAGAFGNPPDWIADAIEHALQRVPDAGLEVVLVGYGEVPAHFRRFAA